SPSIDPLQSSTWGSNNDLTGISHAPGHKRPGKEQNHRRQDCVAIHAIERIRLREQFEGTAEQGCARDDYEATENVKAHDVAHAENENAQQDEPGQKLFGEVRGAPPISA